MEKIFFNDRLGIKIAANLHFPDNFNKEGKYSAIIISGPAGAVKEQTAGLYAEKLAQKGFVTIALDSPFQGESDGKPRFQESPITRVEDIRSAVDYLVTLPYVDENKIGALGICAGGGYVVSSAMTERRIKAIALSSPVNGGREMRAGGSEATIKALEEIASLRTAEARGEKPMIIPWMPEEYKASQDPDEVGGFEYYTNPQRGGVANWDNQMRYSCMDAVMAFDAFYLADLLLTQPIEMCVGDIKGSFGAIEDCNELYNKALSSYKNINVFEGKSHFDFYDDEETVNRVVDIYTNFFDINLK